MSDQVILQCRQVAKSYMEGSSTVHVLNHIDLTVKRGERLAIMGSSGAGKSTLLHVLGGLDMPTKGEVRVGDQNMTALDVAARGRLRNKMLGFVYQFHHLLPEFTALENVCMPLLIRGDSPGSARRKAAALLERVGLGQRLAHKPGELSGGERQRAAVARALVTDPHCILADEPTGNLDKENANKIYELMLELSINNDSALLVVTHEMALAQRMDRVLVLEEGMLNHMPASKAGG